MSGTVGSTSLPPSPSSGPASRRIDFDLVLAHHASQGFTPELVQEIRTLGRAAWIDQQLDPGTIADLESDEFVRRFPSISMSIAQLYSNYWGETIVPVSELQLCCIGRTLLSRRTLYERLVEFWHDHFNVSQLDSNKGKLFFTYYDRSIIRQRALGTFEDLLVATAQSAAMLSYLNGDVNFAGAPNENFAREVMELHSLGVDGPYTETDVRELARCLTGWRYGNEAAPDAGEFFFDASRHDAGEKTVLGTVIPAGGGVEDGLTVLHELAIHPKTLDYVSRKLISWFVGYAPPEAAVVIVTDRWQQSGGDIKEVLRSVLSDEVLTLCQAEDRTKLKRPFHFVTGLLRQLRAETTNDFATVPRKLDPLGQRPYVWRSPDGYPDTELAWGADAFGRWRFASELLDGEIQGLSVAPGTIAALVGGVPKERLAERLSFHLAGGGMEAVEVARVQLYIDSRPLTESVLREAIALLASCPSYQYF
jgi:hypothetical protein